MRMYFLREYDIFNCTRQLDACHLRSSWSSYRAWLIRTISHVTVEADLTLTRADHGQDLAQTGYFEDERFLNYLDYLRPIWTSPEYARFIS